MTHPLFFPATPPFVLYDWYLMFLGSLNCKMEERVNYSCTCMHERLNRDLLYFGIIGLQNDHKALMSEIEEGIHDVHAVAREKKLQNDSSQLVNAGKLCTCSLNFCSMPYSIYSSLSSNFKSLDGKIQL